jgi:putative transposase
MVEEMLAARSIDVSYETVRQWALKFGQKAAKRIRFRASTFGDKWHLDEVVITIKWKHYWLWRAVDQHGYVLDVLVQSRRNTQAAERLMRKLFRKHGKTPRVMVTDKLKSYAAANRKIGLKFVHRQHKGLNNRADVDEGKSVNFARVNVSTPICKGGKCPPTRMDTGFKGCDVRAD